MVQIFYNNINVFTGVGPTPFVSMSQDIIDFGNTWNQVTNITLEGQITGRYVGAQSYRYLNESLTNLISGFSTNFSNFTIRETGVNIYSVDSVVVKSIDVQSSNWYGVLPYKIELTAYESNLFTSNFGVMDPVDEISYQDEDGHFLSYTRKISAKGLNVNGKNAIRNAKDWVLNRKSTDPGVKLSLVKDNPLKNFLIESESEIIDRFNGTYSIEIKYRKNIDQSSPKDAFLNYSVDVSFDEDSGIITATINGSLSGNIMSILHNEYKNLNLHFICNSTVEKLFSQNLSTRIVSSNISENENENILNFSATFNNDYSDDIIVDANVEYNLDHILCISTVNVSATISCKYGDMKQRWAKVENYFKNTFNAFVLANEVYTEETSSQKSLFSQAITESITYKEFDATIDYSAEFSDKKRSLDSNIANMSSNVTYAPSVQIYGTNISATKFREHNIQDLGVAKRSTLQISVSAIGKPSSSKQSVINAATNEVARVRSNYIGSSNSVLEDQSFEISENPHTVSISETRSFEGPRITV